MTRPALLAGLAAAALTLTLPAASEAKRAVPRPVAGVVLAGQAAAPALTTTPLTGAARTEALTAASRALDRMRAIQGGFTQIDAGGQTSTGTFILSRPGRMRFDYAPPAPLLLVSDGTTLAIHHRDLRNTDRVPLRQSPLYFVLKSDINLERDARVTRVERRGGTLMVTVADRRGEVSGTLTLFLEGPNYELREWVVMDGDGSRSQVLLRDVRPATGLNPSLFRVIDQADPTQRGRR